VVPDRCWTCEELGSLADLAAEDPRLVHLESCPRCQALLASYRCFMDGTAARTVPGSREAGRRLAAVLEQEVAACPPADPQGEAGPRTVLPNARSTVKSARWRPGWLWRPALGLAACLAVAFSLWAIGHFPDHHDGPVLFRGETQPSGWMLHAPQTVDGGGLHLSWEAPLADCGFRVEIFDAALEPLETFDTAAGEIVIPAQDRSAWETVSHPLHWRVLAVRGGDVIASSGLSSLPLE
jgi:hypothetical protein